MLVAAGETEAIGVGRGVAAVAFVVAALVIIAALSPRSTIAGRVPLDKPPAVLADRAQQILASIGYTDPVADSASNFTIADGLPALGRRRPIRTPRPMGRAEDGQPAGAVFWYRTSPRLLVPARPSDRT